MPTIRNTLHHAKELWKLAQRYIGDPEFRRLVELADCTLRGLSKSEGDYLGPPTSSRSDSDLTAGRSNPLRDYFDSVTEGRGVWKWLHYFDIYHRHFSKFVGREVHVAEVGIYSGGSLQMWRRYFGPQCRVYGIDIEPACKVYENDHTRIFVGDQADRGFWSRFRESVPQVDILIDDGGHAPEQQIVTLEEMLPHLRPGGVFVCEDVHGVLHEFSAYVHGLAQSLNGCDWAGRDVKANRLQAAVQSIHLYPFITVVEKAEAQVAAFSAPKRGTEWQPFEPGPKSNVLPPQPEVLPQESVRP